MTNRNPDGTFASKPLGYKKKTCTKCGQYLYLRDFYHFGRSKNHPDGYDCRCKECRRKEKNDEYARNRKVPDGTPEERSERMKRAWQTRRKNNTISCKTKIINKCKLLS